MRIGPIPVAVVFASLLLPILAIAATPTSIGFQGFIANSAGVAQNASSSAQSIIVALYDSTSTSATSLYKESQGVVIVNGYFSIEIGKGTPIGATTSIASLAFDTQYYIGVQFTGSPISMASEMSGRSAVSAVAYAYNAYGMVVRASDPATCNVGQMYFNPTLAVMRLCTASNTWTSLTSTSATSSTTIISTATTSISGATNIFFATTTSIVSNATTTLSAPVTLINSTSTTVTSSATTTLTGNTLVINATTTTINSSSTVITGTTTLQNVVLGTLTGYLYALNGIVSATTTGAAASTIIASTTIINASTTNILSTATTSINSSTLYLNSTTTQILSLATTTIESLFNTLIASSTSITSTGTTTLQQQTLVINASSTTIIGTTTLSALSLGNLTGLLNATNGVVTSVATSTLFTTGALSVTAGAASISTSGPGVLMNGNLNVTIGTGNFTAPSNPEFTITGGTGAVLGAGVALTIPDANATTRGLLTVGTQNIAGAKTFVNGFTSNATATISAVLDINSNRLINLASPVSSTDAANKAYVDQLSSSAISYISPVINFATGAVASTTGDRYIISAGAVGFSPCALNNICQNTGIGAWTATVQATGTTAFITALGVTYSYNGSAWVAITGASSHNSLSNIQGGDGIDYFHLGLTDYNSLTGGGAQLAQLKTTGAPSFNALTVTNTTTFNGISYTWPATQASNTVLSTNGSGVLSWITALTANLATNNIFVGNGSGQASAVSMSGDATIASNGALTLANSGVSAGVYGTSTTAQIPVITVDSKGRITSISTSSLALVPQLISTYATTSVTSVGSITSSTSTVLASTTLFGQTIVGNIISTSTATSTFGGGMAITNGNFIVGTSTSIGQKTLEVAGTARISSDLSLLGNMLIADYSNFQLKDNNLTYISKTSGNSLIFGNASTTLVLNSLASAGISANSLRITNVASPTQNADAANKQYVDAFVQGLGWQDPVIAFATTTYASTTGDRYIISTGATGFAPCTFNNICENTGSFTWAQTAVATGTTAYVSQLAQSYTFNGTSWVSLGSSITHNSLNAIQGGDGTNYYHLGLSDYTNIITNTQFGQLKATGTVQFNTATVGQLVATNTAYVASLFATSSTISNQLSAASSTLYGQTLMSNFVATSSGYVGNALVLASSSAALSTTTYALYNNNGTLYWNGSALGSGASATGTAGAIQISNGNGVMTALAGFSFSTSSYILSLGSPNDPIQLYSTTSANGISGNLFLGRLAGTTTSANSGNENIGIGTEALTNLAGGTNNIALGTGVLFMNSTGFGNVGVGDRVLNLNSTGVQNTGVGDNALRFNDTGVGNVGVGAAAASGNTTGNYNVAVGYWALQNATSAAESVVIGRNAGPNASSLGGTYVGASAGSGITFGNYNTLFGYKAGSDISTGQHNLIFGTQLTANNSITTGSNNILFGQGVRYGLSQTGSDQLNIGNLIFGAGIGNNATLATGGVGIGTSTSRYGGALTSGLTLVNSLVLASSTNLSTTSYALYNNNGSLYWNGSAVGTGGGGSASGGLGSIQLSDGAGGFTSTSSLTISTSTGILNLAPFLNATNTILTWNGSPFILASSTAFTTMVGYQAGGTSTSFVASQNTALGYQTLFYDTTGSGNTALGTQAMYNNFSGSSNVAIGRAALSGNQSGFYNVAIGANALDVQTSGSRNVGVGYQAGHNNNTGNDNISIGYQASYLAGNQSGNISIGREAGYGSGPTTGGDNIFMGFQSGYNRTAAAGNIFLGYQSGRDMTTGGNNILLGRNVTATTTTASSSLNIGNIFFGSGLYSGNTVSSAAIDGALAIGTSTNIYGGGLTNGLTLRNALVLASSTALSTTSSALYNNNGTLYWNGSAVGGASSGTNGAIQLSNGAGGFTATSTFVISSSSGSTQLSIGTSTPLTNAALTVASKVGYSGLSLVDLTAGLDQKNWELQSTGGSFGIGTYDDAHTGGIYSFYAARSGTGVSPTVTSAVLGNYVGFGTFPGQSSYPDANVRITAQATTTDIFTIASSTFFGKLLTMNYRGNLGLGTSSPFGKFTIHALNGDGNTTLFAIASSTASATSTLFSIGNTGSTTAANGFNIATGCYAVNGTCLSSGGGGLTGSIGQLAYFSGVNTAVGTSSIVLSTAGNMGVGSSSPFARLSVHANAGETNRTLFAIGSSTAATTTTFVSVSNSGGVTLGSTTPTVVSNTLYNNGGVLWWNGQSLSPNGGGSSFSNLTNATGTRTLDNTNFAQTWNWSTMNTSHALSLSAPSLASGNAVLYIDEPNTGRGLYICCGNTTGDAIKIDGSVVENFTGNKIFVNTPGGSSSGTLLNLNAQGGAPVKALQVSVNTTGNMTNGVVQFNFNGAHTGDGFQVTDSTQTGNAMKMTANALTTGSGLVLSSSNGSLNSTNGLLQIANTGASQNGTLARFQSNSTIGSGLTVLANGNVGIGTSSPYAMLSIFATSSLSGATRNLFVIASSTATFATSTLFAISNTGSTTAANGFNITNGCYALNGTCISGGSSASTLTLTNNSGTSTLATLNGQIFMVGSSTNAAVGTNVGLGYQVFQKVLTSGDSVAMGYQALQNMLNGQSSVAIGSQALWNNSNGSQNIGIGYQAGVINTTGSNNTFLGYAANATANNL